MATSARASTPGLGAEQGQADQRVLKLKFMVSMDPLETETIAFWQNHGALNDVDPSTIQTEVFRLPTTSFAEENGAVVIPRAGCSGTGRGPIRQAKRAATSRSCPSCSIASKRCTRRTAVRGGSRCVTWPGTTPTRNCRRLKNWRWNTTARRWPTCSIRRTRPGWCASPASSWPHSATCATTAAPPPAAGSTSVPGARPAT